MKTKTNLPPNCPATYTCRLAIRVTVVPIPGQTQLGHMFLRGDIRNLLVGVTGMLRLVPGVIVEEQWQD
jgi:hypothetical protein